MFVRIYVMHACIYDLRFFPHDNVFLQTIYMRRAVPRPCCESIVFALFETDWYRGFLRYVAEASDFVSDLMLESRFLSVLAFLEKL